MHSWNLERNRKMWRKQKLNKNAIRIFITWNNAIKWTKGYQEHGIMRNKKNCWDQWTKRETNCSFMLFICQCYMHVYYHYSAPHTLIWLLWVNLKYHQAITLIISFWLGYWTGTIFHSNSIDMWTKRSIQLQANVSWLVDTWEPILQLVRHYNVSLNQFYDILEHLKLPCSVKYPKYWSNTMN